MKKELKSVGVIAIGVFVGMVLFCGFFMMVANYIKTREHELHEKYLNEKEMERRQNQNR